MDASFPYSRPNLIPVNTFQETGLLLKPNSYKWVEIHPDKSAFSLEIDIHAKLDRKGNLSGTLTEVSSGYPAQKIRKKKASGASAAEIIRQTVLDGYSNVLLSQATIKKLTSENSGVKTSAHFTLQHYAIGFKSGLEFRPMVVGYIRKNPFSDSTRQLPITLDAPQHLSLSFHIQLPEDMALKESPKDRIIRIPGAVMKEQYNVDGQTLQYKFTIDINRKDFPPDLYPRLLSFYQHWVNLSHERWFAQE